MAARCVLKATDTHGHATQRQQRLYGYNFTLGSAEVWLLNLTHAYRAMCNGGRASPTHMTRQSGMVISEPLARARTFATDSVLATRALTAVRIGTCKDMHDNWDLSWSQRYTVDI